MRAFLVLFFSLISSSAFAAVLTAKDVQKEIDIHGARSAIKIYFHCRDDRAFNLIEQGARDWVSVATQLLPASTTCVNDRLRESLGNAMLKAPLNILPLVDSTPQLKAKNICLPTFDSDQPKTEILQTLWELEKQLNSVDNQSLQKQMEACIGEVNKLRDSLQQQK